MRIAKPIVLDEQSRRTLERQARGRSTAARVVLRSRIVLLAADGLQNKQIAAQMAVAPRMVALWHNLSETANRGCGHRRFKQRFVAEEPSFPRAGRGESEGFG